MFSALLFAAIALNSPENGAVYDLHSPCVKEFLANSNKRTWQPGDQVKVTFDAAVRTHEQDGCVALTRGPVVLARDSRFNDGDQSEPVCVEGTIPFFDTMPPDASMHLGVTAILKTGGHDHPPRPIGFCDFASAGNTDDRKSFYRVWLPARQ